MSILKSILCVWSPPAVETQTERVVLFCSKEFNHSTRGDLTLKRKRRKICERKWSKLDKVCPDGKKLLLIDVRRGGRDNRIVCWSFASATADNIWLVWNLVCFWRQMNLRLRDANEFRKLSFTCRSLQMLSDSERNVESERTRWKKMKWIFHFPPTTINHKYLWLNCHEKFTL